MQTNQRPCPVCQSLSSKAVFEQRFDPLSGVDFLKGYKVMICAECGMGFADDIPRQGVFDRYYRDLSKYEQHTTGGVASSADKTRFRDIALTLDSFMLGKQCRILEVGCATGGLLAELRELGFHNLHGLDPSPACAQSAWDVYGIPVSARSLFDMPAGLKSFGLLIAGGVLEHIEDLTNALACLRKAVEPSGKIYAEVPDVSRLGGRPDAPFQEFSTEHLNFFSETSLSNLFSRNGFTPITTGHADRLQNEKTICPTVFGLFSPTSTVSQPLPRDDETEAGLLRYITASRAVDVRIQEKIRARAADRKIIVWGAGAHTQRLLAEGAFANIEIAAFVDSNPKYQGRALHDIPVLSPGDTHLHREPILISSRGFEREIADIIRYKLHLPNEVILLYDDEEQGVDLT